MDIQASSNGFGAEIKGIDLRAPDRGQIDDIKQAWLRHKVLVFRDQRLSARELVEFGTNFGELWPHPTVPPLIPETPEIYVLANLIDGKPDHRPPQADIWHTDLTYVEKPSRGGILHAKEVPATGGDTLFADTERAFGMLPERLQDRLLQSWAIHDIGAFLRARVRLLGEPPGQAVSNSGLASVLHPAAVRHPETGTVSLFLNQGFTSRIIGMSEAETAELVDRLTETATRSDNVFRQVWGPHDIVMWDNYCTMHRATGGYAAPMRRVMHRLTIGGNGVVPAGAGAPPASEDGDCLSRAG